MKISARNVLEGKVISCTKGATTAHVKIQVAGGEVISSSITNEAADDLQLSAGKQVMAIIKSSDVLIGAA
jgi:molybdopterin-binding protein